MTSGCLATSRRALVDFQLIIEWPADDVSLFS
nr:MAG TPA: hypothetical protein [Caudoviricetes sp.]